MKKYNIWRVIHTQFGYVQISSLHGKNEMIENIQIARFLANRLGHSIFLLARSEYAKNPDSKNVTLNIFQEYKVNKTPSKSAIDNALRNAAKQANHIVLEIQSNISDGDLRDCILNRVFRTSNIKSLTIIRNGSFQYYSRDRIMQKDWTL